MYCCGRYLHPHPQPSPVLTVPVLTWPLYRTAVRHMTLLYCVQYDAVYYSFPNSNYSLGVFYTSRLNPERNTPPRDFNSRGLNGNFKPLLDHRGFISVLYNTRNRVLVSQLVLSLPLHNRLRSGTATVSYSGCNMRWPFPNGQWT